VVLLKRFGLGLQRARKSRDLTQEDFSDVSSRTYLSSLERGIKAPTITKLDEIATVIGVHPLSLIAYAYVPLCPAERAQFWATIAAEVTSFDSGSAAPAAGKAY
jgi:transcriptional regulator with XRE-family HTH domain